MNRLKYMSLGVVLSLATGCAQEDLAATETSQSATGSDATSMPTATNTVTTPGTTTAPGPTGTPTMTAAPTATGTGAPTTTTTTTGTTTTPPGPTGTMDPVPTASGETGTTEPPPVGSTGATDPVPQGSGGSTDTPPAASNTGGGATDPVPTMSTPTVPGGINPSEFAPELDGFYWEGTCVGSGIDARQCAVESGFDPNNVGGCTVNLDKTMTIAGDAGTKYIMEIEVRGMLGGRCYYGGTRRAGATPPNLTGPNDGLYTGGTVPDNWWNSYEVHVMGGPAEGPNTLYLNSYYDNPTNSITFDPEKCTREDTLEVGYTFEVSVMGNSTILFRINDQNCQAQMNCGPYSGVKECPSPRNVDLVGMDPPATFEQPVQNAVGANVFYPQWAYFDVKSVRVAE